MKIGSKKKKEERFALPAISAPADSKSEDPEPIESPLAKGNRVMIYAIPIGNRIIEEGPAILIKKVGAASLQSGHGWQRWQVRFDGDDESIPSFRDVHIKDRIDDK